MANPDIIPADNNKRLRRCMATVFIEEGEDLSPHLNNCAFIRRWVYQDETAPTTGRLHAQCYLEFASAQYFRVVKRWFASFGHQSVHLEPAVGTPAQCYDYCTKEDTRKDGPWQGCKSIRRYYWWQMCCHECNYYMNDGPQDDSDDNLFDWLALVCDCPNLVVGFDV